MAEEKRMQKPHYESLSAFLEGKESEANPKRMNANSEHPWEYDFKYQYTHGNANKYWNLDEERDSIKRLLKYKIERKDCEEAKPPFDCDGSGEDKERDVCWLTREIYRLLWGWMDKGNPKESYEKGTVSRYAYLSVASFLSFGPDTMNSYMTVLEHALKIDEGKNIFEDFQKKINDRYFDGKETQKAISVLFLYRLLIEMADEGIILSEYIPSAISYADLEDFAEKCHTLGNFTLVPAGFNTDRAGKFNDFWDQSLLYLKQKAQENSALGFERAFTKYINYFFLWDYAIYNGKEGKRAEYHVKSLFSKKFQSAGVQDGSEILVSGIREMPLLEETQIFLENVFWAIRRRGIFMTAMLQLQQEIGEEKYSRLRNDIFAVDTCYKGFDCVIARVVEWLNDNDWVLPDTVRKTLEKEWTVPESKVEPSSK